MSLQGDAGASTAAAAIAYTIRQLIWEAAEQQNTPDAVEFLRRALAKAEEVQKSADDGWW